MIGYENYIYIYMCVCIIVSDYSFVPVNQSFRAFSGESNGFHARKSYHMMSFQTYSWHVPNSQKALPRKVRISSNAVL